MSGIVVLLYLAGGAFIFAPMVLGAAAIVQLGGLIIGVVAWILSSFLALFTAFFQRTSANEAFVRTGRGGASVVLDDGAYVIPLFHRKVPVSLETMKLSVILDGRDHALITKDNLRVNVNAEFYIKVKPDREGILQAARSLGEKSVNAENVEALVREKLVSALRHAAAQMDLFTIHASRDQFAQIVQEHVRRDLIPNGIDLESVTISALDQLDTSELSTINVFDVQGRRKATEITAAQNVETTRLEREAESAIAKKNVETRQTILGLQRTQAEAEATQASEIAQFRAGREREQREFALEQERAVKEAQIAQDLAVQRREVEKEQAMLQAEQQKEQVRIAKEQAVEVATREREIVGAEKAGARAHAEAEALGAQAERERAHQEVMTVQALGQADREAGVKLTAAKQIIEQDKIKKQTEVELEAISDLRRAEVELESARRQAEARLLGAEAEMKAQELEAKGRQAIEMVQINVAREQVHIKEMEVEIERQALENKQTFDRAAIDFEKAKLQIEANKEVQIANARAIGESLSHADFKVYGDPATMGQMISNLGKGLGVGALADGLLLSAPESVKQAVAQVGEMVANAAAHATNGSANSASHINGNAPVVEQNGSALRVQVEAQPLESS